MTKLEMKVAHLFYKANYHKCSCNIRSFHSEQISRYMKKEMTETPNQILRKWLGEKNIWQWKLFAEGKGGARVHKGSFSFLAADSAHEWQNLDTITNDGKRD